MDPIKPDTFTEKQLRFIAEYPRDCNASAAARRAGYSPDSAADIGYELKQSPSIRAAIDEKLKQLAMSADEAVKRISDIAATRLNDFMYTRLVQGYEQTEQYVTVLITHARNEIKQTEAFIGRNKLTKETRKPFDAKIARLYEQVAEYEALVEKYDDGVTLVVAGRPVAHYVTELDLPALAKAQQQGLIKSFKHTKEGIQVEMYPADAALRDILRMNGLYVDKLDVTTNGDSLHAINDARSALLAKLTQGQE